MGETGTRLMYQTVLCAGGQTLKCVEGYDSVFERMRDSHFKGDEAADELRYAQPMELTVASGPENRPVRAAFNPMAITFVVELPEDQREEVPER